jgi:hypothetical protein
MPSVVVVGQASELLDVLVEVVEVVDAAQQKPTASGASCTSLAPHTSRILTLELNVPSRRCFAHRTAAAAGSITKALITSSAANCRMPDRYAHPAPPSTRNSGVGPA